MPVNIIAAVARNRAIGYRNQLLYNLPNDMRHFKELTTGHTVIMGRRTYESLPHGALPNRRNIVLSRSVRNLPGCEVYGSLDEALTACAADEEVFVIGGESVYGEAMTHALRLYLTEVDDTPKQFDTSFPPYDGWKKDAEELHYADERHAFNYSFVTYLRK